MSIFFVVETSLNQTLPTVNGNGPTWADVKQQIEADGGPPVDLSDLFFDSQPLNDGDPVSESGVDPGSTLTVDVRSGVVTYGMTDVDSPPDGSGDNVAYLREGEVLNQLVAPVSAGVAYQLELSLRGTISWSVQFRDAGSSPVGTIWGDIFSGSDAPNLSVRSTIVIGDVGSVEAMLTFVAVGGAAAIFDLVSFRPAPG